MKKPVSHHLWRSASAWAWLAVGMSSAVSAQVTAFVHRATESNIRNNWTVIDHPAANAHPEAILVITPNYNPGGTGGVYDDHAPGVWYTEGKWAIFHQDRTPMIQGAAFNVLVTSPSAALRLMGRRAAETAREAAAGTSTGAPARTVRSDGSAEILYPDGTKVEASSGMKKITRPDGSQSAQLRSQTQAPTPPIPTDEITLRWLQRHGDDLLTIIRQLVTDGEASIQNYLRLEGPDLPLYAKIDKRQSTVFLLLTSP